MNRKRSKIYDFYDIIDDDLQKLRCKNCKSPIIVREL